MLMWLWEGWGGLAVNTISILFVDKMNGCDEQAIHESY